MKETIQRKEVVVPFVRERKIESVGGTLFEPEGRDLFPGVVFYHGRGSNRTGFLSIGKELAENGISALAFDFSSNELDERELEAEAAYQLLQSHPTVVRGNMGILGVSMGAYHAAIMAERFKVRSLVLRAPAVYPSSEKSASIRAIRNFEGDLLIVESEFDEVIPHKIIELYLKNARRAKNKKVRVIKGAPHWLGEPDSPYRKEFRQLVVDWFKRTLVGGGES